MSAQFWFVTSLAMLITFYAGYKFTGMNQPGMRQQIIFSSAKNKFMLGFVFLVSQVILNVIMVAASMSP